MGRTRSGSNTSGSRTIPPWHIEASYRQVTMHLGGIYDEPALAAGRTEYVSRRAMPKRSVTNRVGGSSSSFGSYNSQRERGGLVGNTPPVYYKNEDIGMATNNDSVAGQTVIWPAGLFQNGSYIVLSKIVDVNASYYWALGVIERADLSVTPKDIVIGYVKNSFVTQIWSSDIIAPVTEDVRQEFLCQIDTETKEGEDPKYMLRIQKGTVIFDRYKANAQGIVSATALGGFSAGLVTKTHYVKRYNVFEAGKLTVGANMSSKFIENGKIELTKNKDYVVFVYKVTPDFDMALESIVPQICVSEQKAAPDTTIKTKVNGSGALQSYVDVTTETLKLPTINSSNMIGHFEGSDIQISLNNGPNYEPPSEGCCTCPEYASVADGPIDVYANNVDEVEVVTGIEEKGVGYIKTDCIRHDIAKITWTPDNPEETTPGPGKFVLTQVHTGTIVLRQTPVGPIKIKQLAIEEQASWGEGFDVCTDIKGNFDGYTKTLNSGPESK